MTDHPQYTTVMLCVEWNAYWLNFIIFFSHSSIETILKDFADVANTPVFSAINDMRKMESDFEEFQSDPNFSNMRNIKGKMWWLFL